jgi:hypothetical protein
VYDDLEPSLVQRLQAASFALPITEKLREIADEVYEMDHEGRSDKEIDERIREWTDEAGFGYSAWLADFKTEFAGTLFEGFDLRKLWNAYGIEEWIAECVRSIAFTDEPIPFLPFAAGYWYEDRKSEPPRLIAVMTPLSDPKLAARQLVDKHRTLFGKVASGSPRKDEVFNARMLDRHRNGMSYRDIAIQNLRDRYPDIVRNPRKYKKQLATERERVVKAIRAAEELWNSRGLGDSTPE